jgi:hypothetical protein
MNPLPGTPPLSERESWLLRVAELLARVADAERRADVSEQALADLSCGHGVAVEHRAVLERVAELEAEVARLREALDEAAALSVLDDPEVPR